VPTYEYECQKCAHRFEKFHSMTAKPIRTCPKCKGPVRKIIGSGAGIIFKGKGFYQTDYRSDSYKKKADAEKKDRSSGSSDKKSDSAKKSDQTGSKPSGAKD